MTSCEAASLDGATVSLGGRRVLEDVTLAIEQGAFVGVFGPNGAGKTTLFRALLGLIPPAQGRLRVLGQAPGEANARIGYVPQTAPLAASSRLSGWDYVASAARGARWGLPILDRATRRDVSSALERVGADRLAHRPLGSLSGGERQRLLLAQALLGEPKLMLLDEPLLSLDPPHQRAVIDLVRDIQRERGISVLFSAHELNPLLPVLDRVLYLGGGRAAIGTVEAVVTRPVLSRLYGAEIDVVRTGGRIFVMAAGSDAELGVHCRHDSHGSAHDHRMRVDA